MTRGPRPPAGNVEGPFARPLLARDAVRFVGEPIAVVLADSLAMGQDAAEAVLVEYEPLGAVVGPEGAVAEGAALLFPEAGTNVAHAFEESWDEDVLAEADVVARLRVRHQRLAPVPMETNAILVVPGGEGLTVWVSTQIPFDVRADLEEWFGLEREAIHVIAPDVGGGFGAKLHVYPEYLVCAALAPGGGHLSSGRFWPGVLLLLPASFFEARVLLGHGEFPSPWSLGSAASSWFVGFGAIGFAALWLLSLWLTFRFDE